jgi:septum site-determining protein MinC
MVVVAKGNTPAIFDLKSASMSLLSLVLKTSDLQALQGEMDKRFGPTPEVFNNDPVVLDLSALAEDASAIDFEQLLAVVRRFRLLPLAARGGSEAQMADALLAGLAEGPEGSGARAEGTPREAAPLPDTAPPPAAPEPPPAAAAAAAPPAAIGAETIIIDKPLRAGQQVYARGGDLIMLAAVNFGAELIADGHIHVYAPLRGKAIAGAKGNAQARIFTTCMEPQLVAIAGTYRTTENPLPAEVIGKPAQIRLDGERLVFEPLIP